ncbi:MAG: DUF2116 family Zn-ribbon domain-containing protein [Methanobrevibacter thaueri]|uniref:DUF2116 family Zn-ribbon domain-containing protein n=1 Tax=Methanobrevibacter thaueri TaxID=190975 RepID=A0A8T3V5D2_9EURY|nr:DUF2116 family Zn-ribbon domain-containing protein [Methanobrevibacter thaueri]
MNCPRCGSWIDVGEPFCPDVCIMILMMTTKRMIFINHYIFSFSTLLLL